MVISYDLKFKQMEIDNLFFTKTQSPLGNIMVY